MNHSLRSLLLIAMLALSGLMHTDAFAQQPAPPTPPDPAAAPAVPDVEVEVERAGKAAQEAADEAMREAGSMRLVFSSSCTVYGNPDGGAIDEAHPREQVNPYGRTKLIDQRANGDFAAAYGI